MKTVASLTGFCYIKETSSDNVLLKFDDCGLSDFEIADDLDLVDVADATALEAITIYTAPSVEEPFGNTSSPVPFSFRVTANGAAQSDFVGHIETIHNTTGGLMFVYGVITRLSTWNVLNSLMMVKIQMSPTGEFDEEPGFMNLLYMLETEVLDNYYDAGRPFFFVLPKGWYGRIELQLVDAITGNSYIDVTGAKFTLVA